SGDETLSGVPLGVCQATVDFTVHPFVLPELAHESLWHFLSAQVGANGSFADLTFLNGFLPEGTPIAISGGAGDLVVDARLADGESESGSRADVHGKEARVSWRDYRAVSDALVTAEVRTPTPLHGIATEAALDTALKLRHARIELGDETLLTTDELSV